MANQYEIHDYITKASFICKELIKMQKGNLSSISGNPDK